MKQYARIAIGCIAFLFSIVNFAYSWGSTAHRFINLKAVRHLPNELNSFIVDSLFYGSHASDADYRKDYNDTSFFAEAQRHFIDIDIYPDFQNLPHTLDSVFMIAERQFVRDAGTLPWATKMVLDSLTAQLARGDLSKAKLTMSDLGHYVGDAHQPLHCTLNYNPGGLHSRYETRMINTYQDFLTVNTDSVLYISSPLDFIFEYIYHSNSLVDSLIAADNYAKFFSGWNGIGDAPANYYSALWSRTEGFTKEQVQHATVALASLWYTAWYDAQIINAVNEATGLHPQSFTLEQNYPNPFNPSTVIPYQLSDNSWVTLKLYDAVGKEIATLVDGIKEPGSYKIDWSRNELASGTYFYRLSVTPLVSRDLVPTSRNGQAGTFFQTRKMILEK